LLIAVEKTLLDRGVHTSWESVREPLGTHQDCAIVLPTDRGSEVRIHRASTPEPAHREIYDLLAVPYQPFRAIKTWSASTSDPGLRLTTRHSAQEP
jgi:hypothetical protein